MTYPKEYKDMETYLINICDTLRLHYGGEILQSQGFTNTTRFNMPEEVIEYLCLRRDLLSNLSCRAQDTIQQHMSWHYYYATYTEGSPIADMTVWEYLYQSINNETGIPISALHCLEMRINEDPAKPYVTITDTKPSIIDDRTTPEYTALFYSLYDSHDDWDLSSLKKPLITISQEDNDEMKELTGISLFDAIMSIPTGEEVYLA